MAKGNWANYLRIIKTWASQSGVRVTIYDNKLEPGTSPSLS